MRQRRVFRDGHCWPSSPPAGAVGCVAGESAAKRSIRRRCPRVVFTTPESGANAFSIPIAMLDAEQAAAFAKGKEQFNEAWVVAPDPSGVWGLGPTFNEDRCAHCHENNGRAAAPATRTAGRARACWCA